MEDDFLVKAQWPQWKLGQNTISSDSRCHAAANLDLFLHGYFTALLVGLEEPRVVLIDKIHFAIRGHRTIEENFYIERL